MATLVLWHCSEPDGDGINVHFQANVKGVAPGQSAVFYEGDDVIGGGIIQQGLNNN